MLFAMKINSNKILILIILIALSFGFIEGIIREPDPRGALFLPYMILMAILAFVWCKRHVKENGISEPTGSSFLCGMITIIGVPLYFFRAFGFKKGIIGSLKGLGFILSVAILYGLSKSIAELYFL
jgi:hypothetical protein